MTLPQAARKAALQFIDDNTSPNVTPLGEGLINDTFRVDEHCGASFVLQRINTAVFPNAPAILSNHRILLDHLTGKHRGGYSLCIPALRRTRSGLDYFVDDHENVWRAQEYLPETHNLRRVTRLTQAIAIGKALGQFHALFADLPPERLFDTLPNFHITPWYLSHYDAIRATPVRFQTDPQLPTALDYVEAGRSRVAVLENAKARGDLPIRVTHGDPKLDNMLFDRTEDRVIGLIDLDTVKGGLPHHDLADCLRSCCKRSDSGSEPFDITVMDSLVQAYHQETVSHTHEHERAYWYEAIRLIPYELGLRFLTDYLEGNRYFKVEYPEQNLHRALEQFRLGESVERQEATIKKIIEAL